ncbi:MAG TPA: hypothetical protein VEW93_11165 [Acidimicrobiales bacterium]|nr:hypothetical protein [Acidimicrobiales bacterium]
MSRTARTRPTVARIAAVAAVSATPVAVVAQAPAPAASFDLVELCTTETLAIEDVQNGATSTLDCDWVDPEELSNRSLLSVVATHYANSGGAGAILDVGGSCDGSIAFATNDPWNNLISSTRQRSCGVIKHFDNINLTGDNEAHDGAGGTLLNLSSMDNRASSVGYA